MSKKAIEDYAEAIQNHFGQKRGASLILSCDDFLKIEEWFEKGIPLRAIEKGIDHYFEKLDPSRRRRAVVLRFAEGAILNEWEIMKAGGVSESGRRRSPEDEAAERKKRREIFVHRCRKARMGAELWAQSLFDKLIAQAEGRMEIVTAREDRKFTDEDIEDFADTWLRRNTTPERMRTARRAAEQQLAPFKPRMDEKIYLEVLERNAIGALRIELGVPSLLEQ